MSDLTDISCADFEVEFSAEDLREALVHLCAAAHVAAQTRMRGGTARAMECLAQELERRATAIVE